MRYILLISILLSLPVCYAQQQHGHETSQTTLVVEVKNATAKGRSVVGDVVTVDFYRHGEVIGHLEGKVGAGGRTTFENAPAGEHIMALARTKHQEMAFSSHAVEVKKIGHPVFIRVKAYDVSHDNSVLTIGTHHMIIKAQDDSLVVTEYVELRNNTDRALTSNNKDEEGRNIIIQIKLPEGYKDLTATNYFEQSALVLTDDGFYDTMAIPPGAYQAIFSYTLDIDGSTMNLTKQMSLPTDEFILFSQLGENKLAGLGNPHGSFTTQEGTPSEYFSFPRLKSGDKIDFQVTGLNYGASGRDTVIMLSIIFAVIAVLIVVRLVSSKIKKAS